MEKLLYINAFIHPDINTIIKNFYVNMFPRPHGCYIFNIKDECISNFIKVNKTQYEKIKGYDGSCAIHPQDMEKIIMDYVMIKHKNIIYGDIILIDHANRKFDTKYFYNGTTIIAIDSYLHFDVIINNIPIDYWASVFNNVYFELNLSLRVDCAWNITFGLVTKSLYGVFTTFIYNNKTYRIIYNFTKCNSNLYNKYLYTTKRKWKHLEHDFTANIFTNGSNFYVPPIKLRDGYTLILNNKL